MSSWARPYNKTAMGSGPRWDAGRTPGRTASRDIGAKTYIKVPFAEKDQAKALGARWDPDRKSWYIYPTLDRNKFKRWMQPIE